MQGKIRVAVVFGGRSNEHAVSCASASLVLGALDPDRYEVLPIGITRDGRWVLTSGDPGRIAASALPSVEAVDGASVVPLPGPELQIVSPGSVPRSLGEVDVVLPLLHGAYGEDGTLQGLLELTGTRYAGAGVFASAAGLDKGYMKLILAAHGLPIGRYVVVRDRDWRSGSQERKRLLDEIAEFGYPVFVKPARGGSSIGISRVDSFTDLEQAIEAAREHDPKVLVEAAVEGMEVECAVLEGVDGGPPEASVPGQVLMSENSAFYDFEAKYLASAETMRIPAPIPAATAAEIRRMAGAAFDAISCEGLARVDFFYTPSGTILVNEINTMPGMTAASGFPLMWAATGLPLPQLMDRIITTAMAKRPGLRLRQPALRHAGWMLASPQTTDGGSEGCLPPVPPSVCTGLGLGLGLLLLGRRLAAVHQRLEVRARAELRHRGRRHVDGLAGGRVTGRASRAVALLEDAETGDGHLVALGDGGLDGLKHRVHGFGRGLLVPHPIRDRVDQITLVHSSLLRFPHWRSLGFRFRGSRPLTCPKVGDPAPLHNNHGHIRRRVGPKSAVVMTRFQRDAFGPALFAYNSHGLVARRRGPSGRSVRTFRPDH
jgi:D-alanine--D-alanine ligase